MAIMQKIKDICREKINLLKAIDSGNFFQLLANISTTIGVLVALGVFFQGYYIYKENYEFNSEAKAVELYRDWLEYAETHWADAEFEIHLNKGSESDSQYRWLVNYTMATASSMYKLTNGDPVWNKIIEGMASPHIDYLKKSKIDYDQFGGEFGAYLRQIDSKLTKHRAQKILTEP